MDNLLDAYFKKARESLSEPVPIAEIRKKLIDSPGANGSKRWLPVRFQVILVLAVVFLALYLLVDYLASSQKMVVDKETPTQEVILTKPEDVLPQQKKTPVQEVMPDPNDIEFSEKMDADVLPLEDDKATVRSQIAETSKSTATENPSAVLSASKEPDATTETEVLNSDNTSDPVNLYKFLVDKPKERSPDVVPEETVPDDADADADNLITKHQFEILPNFSERRLKKLDKELAVYGITIKIDALKYSNEKISKFKGAFVSIDTNAKAWFNFKSTFNKVILNFEYSKSKGPQNMVVSGK